MGHYPGEITRAHSNGTYDIKFDDGERKSSVKKSQIRSLNKGKKSSSSTRRNKRKNDSDESDADDRRTSRKSSKKHRRGDRVEAKVRGWTKYYGGEIIRVNDDGTYDIKFDDGERKRGVKNSEIKEAKVRGWAKYYGGEIIRVNDDGTYDIKFDDGER